MGSRDAVDSRKKQRCVMRAVVVKERLQVLCVRWSALQQMLASALLKGIE